MTNKYERQCWSCGGKDMEDLETHVKCRSCGATWNAVPQVGGPLTEPGNVQILDHGSITSMRARHPSGGVKRRATRTRRAVT